MYKYIDYNIYFVYVSMQVLYYIYQENYICEDIEPLDLIFLNECLMKYIVHTRITI